MNTVHIRQCVYGVMILLGLGLGQPAAAETAASAVPCGWVKDSVTKTERELVAKYGEEQRLRIHRGLGQMGQFWRAEDGDAAAFEAFALQNFAGRQEALDVLFARFERLLEKLGGQDRKSVV